jgi:type III secretion protein U
VSRTGAADEKKCDAAGRVSENPTHEATPRRLARAVQRFGAPRSPELTAACLLSVLWLGLPALVAQFMRQERALWSDLLGALAAPVPSGVVPGALIELVRIATLSVLGLALAAVAATWLQRGLALRAGGSFPEFAGVRAPRLAPADAALRVLKWLLLTAALLWPWSAAVRGMLGSFERAPGELLPIAGELCARLIGRAALVLAILGAIDLGVQHWLFRRRLRVGASQQREERRADEPEPHALAERRRRAHELLLAASLLEVSELESVVCESQRRAVGVRAPGVVWLKAEGELALRLLEAARQAGLPIVDDARLLEALSSYELNEALPAALRAQLPMPSAEAWA